LANTQMLIAEAYSAFNRRDIDGALALMSENVSWPKASEGGRVVGKEEIAPTGRVSGRSLTLTWNRWK
jgi:ketosteroid isomerase-like protein